MRNKIKEVRQEVGMTIQQLADKTKLSTGYICHLEKGTRSNPTFCTMQKIATALNKSIDEIFNQND